MESDEIIEFDRLLCQLLNESYTWELWGAAYIINDGCSDDGFDYFRAWLISQGREVFENANKNPDSLAGIEDLEENVEFEELLYAANRAYEKVTGEEMTLIPNSLPLLDEGWDFDDTVEMKKRYPRLCKRFNW